jgi:hypothetical protein
MMPERAEALSSASPVARALYEELLRAIAPFGAFEIEVKKSSIHLVRSSAFAGVHPRKQYLLITIEAAAPIPSGRIIITEQVSTNRWHLDVKVSIAGDFDAELLGWLREAYEIC